MSTEDNKFAKLLVERKHLLNDVAGINYCGSTKPRRGFSRPSTYFCDNIVLWALCHDHTKADENKSFATTNAMAIGNIRSILKEYIGKPNLKYIGRGMDRDPDVVRRKIHRKRETTLEMGSVEYIHGYIATKVSLSEMPLDEVHWLLATVEEQLRGHYIVLHDIDISCDCAGITTRKLVEEYLVTNGISIQKVVPDRSKVGDDCISWMDEKRRRCKVYNKFVQMLQSCDVRKPLGSLVADLVYNHDPKFAEKLLAYRRKGMTRVEMTIYSSKICSIDWYANEMDELLDFLDECPVHRVSFDGQWEKITQRLTSVLAMHVTDKTVKPPKVVFAYCHWWNSITGKMQGYARNKVAEDDVKKLLANFSFNDRPIYFVKGKLGSGGLKIIDESTWQREKNCEAITLVPGSGRGLYPSYHGLKGKALDFEDVGLSTSNGITLGWPRKRIDKRSKALAKISRTKKSIPKKEEEGDESSSDDNDDDGQLREVNISSCGRFMSAHSLAKNNQPRTYAIVGYGRRMFRGKMTTYLVAKDGVNIQCTRSLQEIVEEEIVSGVHFNVHIKGPTKINGYRDVECYLV